MTQNKRIAKINRTAPHRDSGGSFSWDVSAYAFDPNYLERVALRKEKQAYDAQRYHDKKKAKEGRNGRADMNKRYGDL